MKAKVYAAFYSKERGKEGWPSKDLAPELRRDYLLRKIKSMERS